MDWIAFRSIGSAPRNPDQPWDAWDLTRHAIESHSRLEEDLLLPALESRLTGAAQPAVSFTHEEHRRIAELFGNAARGRAPEPAAIAETVALLRSHFRHEEETLFPLVRKALTPGHLEQLGRAWTEAREFRPAVAQP
ncbi:MAG: hemerythrin domain-containing protein [Candidatus Coatesbacteria bacterium]